MPFIIFCLGNLNVFEKECQLIEDDDLLQEYTLAFRKKSLKIELNLKHLEKKKLNCQIKLLNLIKDFSYNDDKINKITIADNLLFRTTYFLT